MFSRSALAAASLLAVIAAPTFAAEKPLARADVEKIVRDYIIAHPEVLVESLQKLDAKRAEDQAAASKLAIAQYKDALFNDAASPATGNPKGDVTVVEFFDYNCGYCKHLLPVVSELLAKDKNVRVVFKEFPILSPSSQLASKAGLAVHRLAPEKYFDFHRELMQQKGELTEALLLDTAGKLGLDKDKVKAEMASPDVEKALDANRKLGISLGIQGTPAIVVGNELIPGATDLQGLEAKIAAARAGKK